MIEQSPRGPASRWWVGPLFLALVCLGVYANAIDNPFHFDDISIILTDPRVQGFEVEELLTGNYWYLPNTDRLYRPVALLSYAINWAILPEAWAFRLVNLALHWGVAMLVVSLTRRTFKSPAAGWTAGILFVIHPLTTEPINTIIGRADMLAALSVLGAAVLWWDDADATERRSWSRPILAATVFGLGLLSKENTITLLGVVLLLDVVRWGWRIPKERWIRAYLPIVLVTGGYLGLRLACLGSLTSDDAVIDYFENPIAHPQHDLDAAAGESAWLVRWGTPLATLAKATKLTLLPTNLCFDYSYAALPPVRRWSDERMWWGGLIVAIGLVVCVVSFGHQRHVLLSLGLAGVTYFIVSNFAVVIGTIFGERLLYLPLVGYCMIWGLIGAYAWRLRREGQWHFESAPGMIGLAVIFALTGYAGLTVKRNIDWKSEANLYSAAYLVNPRSCKVMVGKAAQLLEQGKLTAALRLCDEVTHEQTGVAIEYWPAWRSAGVILERMSRQSADPSKADFFEQQALGVYGRALEFGAGGDPDAVLGAARLLVQRNGDYQQAIRLATEFLNHRPTNLRAMNNLSRWLIQAEPAEFKNPSEALTWIRRARQLAPNIANYAATEVDVLIALGKLDEAKALAERQLESLPKDSPGADEFRARLEFITDQE